MRLSEFLGVWELRREIVDYRSEQTSTLRGQAVLHGDDHVAEYHETGILRTGGAELQTSRRYVWVQGQGSIEVRFEDGRDFHHIKAGRAPQAGHFCDPDQYDVSYDFASKPDWSSVWRVKGPRKDYLMTSWYTQGS